MNKQPSRLTLALDEGTVKLLRDLEKFTGLSPAQTIQKIATSHIGEFWDYLTWLEQLPKDGSAKSQLGPMLLKTIGTGTLTEAIKKIDPTYNFSERTTA